MEPGAPDSGVLAWATTDDPIDVLLGEHRTILRMMDEVERESCRLEQDGLLREGFWSDLLRFCDDFDTGLHHHKEERLLFPLLEAGFPTSTQGPTAVLRDEHLRCQFWRNRIEQALRQRDRNRLGAAVGSYVDLVRSHVLKENQILLPLARRLLDSESLQRLHREFRLLSADQRLSYWLRHPAPQQRDLPPASSSRLAAGGAAANGNAG